MASVRRHPKSPDRWQVRYVDPAGRQRSRNFTKKSDADKFVSTVEADKLRGDWIDPRLAKTQLTEFVGDWLKTKVNLKPKTRAGYESLLRTLILPEFGGTALGRIQTLTIREWVKRLDGSGLSPSRIRQAYRLLSSILRDAVEAGYLTRSPCLGVDLPRERPREMRYLTAPEVDRLAQVIAKPFDTLVYLLAYGGLRWGEATALRRHRCQLLRSRVLVVESLSEVNGHLYFGPTKTWQNREIALPRFLVDRLAAHLKEHVPDPEGLVFATTGRAGSCSGSDCGLPLRHSNFTRRVWQPATKAAGLEGLRIHDLRHTAAALLISERAHMKAVQAHLGHSSITVTMDRYGHLYPSDQDDLAARLDRRFQAVASG